jgi:two-component sensor histidine kinase
MPLIKGQRLMRIKFVTFFILSFFLNQILIAQNSDLNSQIIRIDSFIYMSNYQHPLELIDSLLPLVKKENSTKSSLEQKLQILLRQAFIQERIERDKEALETLLVVNEEAKANGFHEIACKANLQLALIYEKNGDDEYCQKSLNQAFYLAEKHGLEKLYSRFYVRKSSSYRVTQRVDSALIFAHTALEYALKNNMADDIMDSYLLLGLLYAKLDYDKSTKYQLLTINEYLKRDDLNKVSKTYHNLAWLSIDNKQLEKALAYNDSAFVFLDRVKANNITEIDKYKAPLLRQKSKIFELTGNLDSAMSYLKDFYAIEIGLVRKSNSADVKKITEQFENDKKEAIIKTKNAWLIFSIILGTIIAGFAVALYFQNRKINAQNNLINSQVDELQKNLGQKQILLSELQHRVKNNLQYVISILEIQKESINFNNIDELIRENINRIQSMALLHHRLSINENINEVNIGLYLQELTSLVRESYLNINNRVSIVTHCSIEKVNLETALPLGLIIVELISNSIKHAFQTKVDGLIEISLWTEKLTGKKILNYIDNGKGFNFHMTDSNGLGLEIIKGLIDQLNGEANVNSGDGFQIAISF